jgi:3-hydroxyisobutyrate dehydrogenase-like beta-hydroxyacid dehydrogenase
MATNLARAGYAIMVFDLRAEAFTAPVAEGAIAATSLKELVEFADVIHLSLVYETGQVLTGEDGVFTHSRPGQTVVIHSTAQPNVVIDLAEKAKAFGIEVIDAPVSGGSLAEKDTAMNSSAETLTMMVGASEQGFERVRPFLETMATVFRVGEVGAGEATKLANGLMNTCNRLVYLEGLQLAEAFGVDEESFNEVVTRSTGMSYAQVNRDRNDRRWKHHTFTADELPIRYTKDIRYAVQMGLDKLLNLPIAFLGSQIAPDVYSRRWKRMEAEAKAAEKAGQQ